MITQHAYILDPRCPVCASTAVKNTSVDILNRTIQLKHTCTQCRSEWHAFFVCANFTVDVESQQCQWCQEWRPPAVMLTKHKCNDCHSGEQQ